MNLTCVSRYKPIIRYNDFISAGALIQACVMYNLLKVDPSVWSQYPVLQDLFDDLPLKPYCAPYKGVCYVKPKTLAIKEHYLQPNHPAVIKWLCFDIDHPDALFAYYDNHLPRPQVIIVNPENGHAHVCYRLKEAIGLTGESRSKPIHFMRAVYHSLRRSLGADAGYVGNLIKNPFARDIWDTYLTGAEDYSLMELADLADLKEVPVANDEVFGRNISLFDHTRHNAYPIADHHSYDTLLKELIDIATVYNLTFDTPLFSKEVHGVCKSIAKFCKSARFNTGKVSEAHRETQRIRGSIGGKKSKRTAVATSAVTTKPWLELGISRSTYYKNRKRETNETKRESLSTPWKAMGVSRATYYRRLKV